VAVTVYFARHAEAHNPRKILYGRLPRIDLSANGRQQALALGAAMAQLPLSAIYSSPLLRARRTALAIAEHHLGVRIILSKLLLETRHPYQGRTNAEVAKLGDRAYDPDILGEEGETIAQQSERLARFLRLVDRRHPGQVVATVSHADPIAALRSQLLGKELVTASLRHEAPPLASVFRIELDDEGATRLEWFWKPPAAATKAAATSEAGSAVDGVPGEQHASPGTQQEQIERAS
jgi:probable phosphoglycerate mutase